MCVCPGSLRSRFLLAAPRPPGLEAPAPGAEARGEGPQLGCAWRRPGVRPDRPLSAPLLGVGGRVRGRPGVSPRRGFESWRVLRGSSREGCQLCAAVRFGFQRVLGGGRAQKQPLLLSFCEPGWESFVLGGPRWATEDSGKWAFG